MIEHARRELEMDTRALPLVRGNFGHHVRRVQEWLCLHGFHTAIDGDFGPATEAALKAFQREYEEPLWAPDGTGLGEVGSPTWLALTGPLRRVVEWKPHKTVSDGRNIVDCASTHLAAHPIEVGKPNGGPFVRYFCRGEEVAWCAGFATTVVGQALSTDEWYTLSCDELAAIAKRRGLFLRAEMRAAGFGPSVQPGDLFLVRRVVEEGPVMNDWIHCGIVTAVHAEHVETIEGNTNTDGSREGTAVHARVRAFRPNVDFVLTGGER